MLQLLNLVLVARPYTVVQMQSIFLLALPLTKGENLVARYMFNDNDC